MNMPGLMFGAAIKRCWDMVRMAGRGCWSAILVALLTAGWSLSANAIGFVGGLGGSTGFGTLAMSGNDDGSSALIPLGAGFPNGLRFYGQTYTSLYINNNGNVTFRSPVGTYTPNPFPQTSVPMIAPYWGDVDTRRALPDGNLNNVYYSTVAPGQFVVTWNYVGYYNTAIDKLNAFQMILTDRSDVAPGDFDIEFRYPQLQWTTGSASGGSNGLGGTPAQMGFDAGDRINYYSHPYSRTAQILTLAATSNVDLPGVWRFTVRSGMVAPVVIPKLTNVRVISTLSGANLALDPASFTKAPYSVSTVDNKTVIEWRYDTLAANRIEDLDYEIVLKDPRPGESRLVTERLELTYVDVNGKPVRTELGSQHVNVLPSSYAIEAHTDKATYGPNEPVAITSLVTNLSSFAANLAVKVSLLDANDALVSTLGTLPSQPVTAGGQQTYAGPYLTTGVTYSGTYKVLSEVIDTNGQSVTSATTGFTIASGTADGGAEITSSLVLDKQIYPATSTVLITGRVFNHAVNATASGLTLMETVTDPFGHVTDLGNRALRDILPSQSGDQSYQHALRQAPVGTYTVTQTVKSATGTVIDVQSKAFAVASSADTGFGLTGTVATAPKEVYLRDPVTLSFSAVNKGNAGYTGLPMTLRLVNPATNTIVAEYPMNTDLAVDGVYTGSENWTAAGKYGDVLVAVLSAVVGGTEIALAQDTVTILKPPIELAIDQTVSGQVRILVLASCAEGGPDPEACDRTRADAIAALLDGLGVSYRIVTRVDDFEAAFRSGVYDVYWLSGKQDKLANDLAAEVREAIYRGDSLLVDGTHDERNHLLDEAEGVSYQGKQGEQDLIARIDGPWFATADLAATSLATAGRADTLALQGGTVQATLAAKTPTPAIVSHTYGAGQSLGFGFDLIASHAQEPAWADILAAGIEHIVPATPDILTGGAYLPILTRLRNLGIATEVRATTQLPPGARHLDSTPAATVTPDGASIAWQFPLAEAGTQDLLLGLTVPLDTGDYHLATVIETLDGGVATPYGPTLDLAFSVRALAERRTDAETGIQALPVTSQQDRQRRDQALDALDDAQARTGQGDHAGAIDALLTTVDRLRDIQTADTAEARQAVDWLLKETEARWYQTRAGQ